MDATCEKCGGACCKVVWMETSLANQQFMLRTRACVPIVGGVLIKSRCKHLSPYGKCEAYAARPEACVRWEVGGAECKEVRKAMGT